MLHDGVLGGRGCGPVGVDVGDGDDFGAVRLGAEGRNVGAGGDASGADNSDADAWGVWLGA